MDSLRMVNLYEENNNVITEWYYDNTYSVNVVLIIV